MRSRQFLIQMPTEAETDAYVDIPIEGTSSWGTPGTASVAVAAGTDGWYAEQRNRPIRVPVKAGSAATPATGFVPLFRLGFSLSFQPVTGISGNDGASMAVPRVQCSRSLVGDVLSGTGSTTTRGDDTFLDPSGVPTIRVHNSGDSDIAGRLFRMFLTVSEAKDEDGVKGRN